MAKKHGGGPKGSCPRNKQIQKARIETAVELQIKGLPVQDVANLMGSGRNTINAWNKIAEQQGWIEQIRERLARDMLPKAVNVYDEILSMSAEMLNEKDIVKAQEIRLKAARDVATGLGAFRKDSKTVTEKRTLDLAGYMEVRETRERLKDLHGKDRERGLPAALTALGGEEGRDGVYGDEPNGDGEGMEGRDGSRGDPGSGSWVEGVFHDALSGHPSVDSEGDGEGSAADSGLREDAQVDADLDNEELL